VGRLGIRLCAKHFVSLTALADREGQSLYDYNGSLTDLLRRVGSLE